ncbi:hypothetical protein [Corynebacterium casei]|uniref:hypothetical protein n=1 Tax=Corynebacterium casei TaxID=160386 RepID=UPI003FD0F09A
MTYNFVQSPKVVQRDGRGGIQRDDVHLDRMAAYLVAMNGDPVVESVDLAEACNAVATTPAATPDLARVKLKP